MRILDKFIAPKEVKACKTALTKLRPLFANVFLTDAVLLRVASMMSDRKDWPHIVNSVHNVGVSPRDTVLYAIVQ